MDGRLAVMFVQAEVVSEELAAGATPGVEFVVVVGPILGIVKVVIAVLAVVVSGALDPVLLETDPGVKVDVAVFVPIVQARGTKVLVERGPAGKYTCRRDRTYRNPSIS
jgi:phage-related holin